jgi:signal transduction histidine kinase
MGHPQLPPAPHIHPVPPHHLRWYGRFWDVLSIFVFGAVTVMVLAADWGALTWRHWAVVGLTVVQGALYVFCIALRGWPIARRWLAMYFILGPALWVISGLILPTSWWLGMTYFGQMFGLLPPLAVLPGVTVITALILFYIAEWNPANITPDLGLGFLFQWAAGMAVYLFILSIIRTSQSRGRLVAQLEAAQRELEVARQKDVELATLRERERLARDLHDSLGHALAVMAVQLEAIQRLYKVDPERGAEHVDELKALTRRSMADLRRSLEGLRAPGLNDRSLTEALHTLSIETGQRANLHVECHVPPEANALSPAISETLWRVAQESLTNIERHAEARHVHVHVTLTPHAVTLTVSDDGHGLSPNAETRPGHYGLRGMRERVEGLGGTLTLTPTSPGLRVEAQLPIIGEALLPSPPNIL